MPGLGNGDLGRGLLVAALQAMLVALERVPLVGAVVQWGDRCNQVLREIEREQADRALDERLRQLEELAAIAPEDARRLALEVAGEGDGDRADALADLATTIPALVAQSLRLPQARAAATTALPLADGCAPRERQAFYARFLPLVRPAHRPGDPVPHRGGWRFERWLGAGGFGEVWCVHHARLDQRQALKLCREGSEAAAALRREADALARVRTLRHPGIVRVEDLNVEVEPHWIALEHLPGGTLENVIRGFGGPPGHAEALRWFAPVAHAVAAAHAAGIVHRDLKPGNVLLDAEGRPRVADFGLADLLAGDGAARMLVSLQSVLTISGAGTPIYMSPEQRRGDPADPADDVYALGVLLFQLLAGSPTEPPDYPQRTLEPLAPPNLLLDLVCDCIGRPRDERPRDAQQLLDRLAPLLPAEAPSAPAASSPIAGADLDALDRRLYEISGDHQGDPPLEGEAFLDLFAELTEQGLAAGRKRKTVREHLDGQARRWRDDAARAAAERAERAAWEAARAADTEEAYQSYLQRTTLAWHRGAAEQRLAELRRAAQARQQAEEELWKQAALLDTEAAYRDYFKRSDLRSHQADAERRIAEIRDEAAWQAACEADTAESYGRYLEDPAPHAWAEQAHTLLTERTHAEAKEGYDAACRIGTIKGWERYLDGHGAGPWGDEAADELRRLRTRRARRTAWYLQLANVLLWFSIPLVVAILAQATAVLGLLPLALFGVFGVARRLATAWPMRRPVPPASLMGVSLRNRITIVLAPWLLLGSVTLGSVGIVGFARLSGHEVKGKTPGQPVVAGEPGASIGRPVAPGEPGASMEAALEVALGRDYSFRTTGWFRIAVRPGVPVTVRIDFRHEEGDLDLYVYWLDTARGGSYSRLNSETVTITPTVSPIYIRVAGYVQTKRAHDYRYVQTKRAQDYRLRIDQQQ